MAYKFIKQSEEKGWDKKAKAKEITYDSVVGKICDATIKKLSGRDLDNVLRVSTNPDTYTLRLFYGVKYIYSCEITLDGDDKGKGIKAAKKEAKAAINDLRTSRRIVGNEEMVRDEGLHKEIKKAFDDRKAANAQAEITRMKKAEAEEAAAKAKLDNKDKDKNKVVEPAKPAIPGIPSPKKI